MALLFAALNELAQLFRAGDPLDHLHDLNFSGLHPGLNVRRLLRNGLKGVFFLFGAHFFSSIYAFFC